MGDEIRASAEDVCDGDVSVRIASVTSNQPENGTGDGNTAPDVAFGSGALCVRAERAGTNQSPREYTVVLEAEDAAGNIAETTFTIVVNHDQAQGGACNMPETMERVADDDPRCIASLPDPQPVQAPASEDDGNDDGAGEGAGCAIASGRTAGASGAVSLLAVAAAAIGIRRSRRSRRSSLAARFLLCSSLAVTGCSSSPDDGSSTSDDDADGAAAQDAAALRACAAGVWLAPAHACTCTGDALDTTECGAADCEMRNVLILDADDTVIEGLVRLSTSASTTSMVGGDGAASLSTWRIDDATSEYVQERGGKTTRLEATCEGNTFSRSRGPSFVRAEASVRTQLFGDDGLPDKK